MLLSSFRVNTMRKQEMLELHEKMVTIKDMISNMPGTDVDAFTNYEDVGITPADSTLSKDKHKRAVFVLGQDLANVMNEDEFSDVGRIGMRMGELAEEV